MATIERRRSRYDERGYTYTRRNPDGSYVHVADGDDMSPRQTSDDYDACCGWCYLGAPHSEREHDRKLDAKGAL